MGLVDRKNESSAAAACWAVVDRAVASGAAFSAAGAAVAAANAAIR